MSNTTTTQQPSATTDLSTDMREELDARILRSLGERRARRAFRSRPSCWDYLEQQVMEASTVLWETSCVAESDDLLAYCVYMAREIEVTEAMNLDATSEWERLQHVAPRAMAVLDVIGGDLLANEAKDTTRAAIARAFRAIRAELACANRLAWVSAA